MKKMRLAICVWIVVWFTPLPQSQEFKKVRVDIPTLSLIVASSLIPGERGYFRQEGLDVELIVIRSAPSVLALTAKENDFLTIGGGLIGILRGLPLRVAFAPLNRPTYALYAKPDIRSFADLDGKRVGISSFGSGPDLLLRDLLKKRMADGGKKVTILAGGGIERFIAFKSGVVDAAVLATPFTVNARQEDYCELFSFINERDYADIPVATFTREDMLQSNASLVERFVRAQIKGLLFMRQPGPDRFPLARALKVKEDAVSCGFDELRPALAEDGTIRPGGTAKGARLSRQSRGAQRSAAARQELRLFDRQESLPRTSGARLETDGVESEGLGISKIFTS